MKFIEWFQRVALIWRRLRKRTLGKKRWSTIWTSKMVLVHPSPYMGVQAPFSTIRFGNVQQKGSTTERKKIWDELTKQERGELEMTDATRTKHFSFTPHFWNTRDNSGLITLYVHHESIIVKHEFNVAFGMRSRLSISPLAASRKGRPCFISQQDPRFPESASWRCTSSGPR